MTTNGVPNAKALLNGSGYMELNLQVSDPELVEALSEREEGSERHEFAVSALKIGAIALRQAQGRIDAERIRQEGDRFIENMKRDLEEHRLGVTRQISDSLKDYFDPESGRFNERVKRLVDDGGEIERVIRQQIAEDGAQLVDAMSAHIGADSPLMRRLDPNATDGLITQLAKSTEDTLTEQRDVILREFSLDNRNGALNHLVVELTSKHGEVGEALEKRIDKVTGEFSLDREDSALSRLMSRVERAQRQISSEFSLDENSSALARMQNTLLKTLDQQQRTNRDFQEEVKGALREMAARRQEAEKSTRHGLVFEDDVFEFINKRSQKAGDMATPTGNTTGILRANKKGDVVMKLGADHAAAGAQIVFEAKQDASYTLDKALTEIEEARKNRQAGVGVFVFSKRTVRDSLNIEPFSRHGDDIVVVWDSEDPDSDVYLDAGISVAKAISVQARSQSEEVEKDFEIIDKAIAEIGRNAANLQDVSDAAGSIDRQVSKILDRVRIVRNGIERQVGILNEQVDSLR